MSKIQLGKQAEHYVKLGTEIDDAIKLQIQQVLVNNADLFAWTAADMPGIDPKIISHRLSICPEAKPVAQRKRRFGGDKKEAIREETKKLIKVNFI